VSIWAEAKDQSSSKYLITYLSLLFVFLLTGLLRTLVHGYLIVNSSTVLHDKMTERVARAEILFYDSNPIGRILTRFSKDVVTLD